MKRAVIYTRVSTAEQTRGTSLTVQEEECRRYCASVEMEVDCVLSDRGESAKTADRPQFQELFKYCLANRGLLTHVVVHKLDRFSRNTEDALVCRGLLAKYGISLASATEPMEDSPVGKLMSTILSGIAEFDNSMRAERSRKNMVELVNQGYWVHIAPIGYKTTRDAARRPILVEHPTDGPIVRQLFEMVAHRGCRMHQVLEAANRLGLRQKSGKPLLAQHVDKFLRKPIYCGRIVGELTNGRVLKAAFTPLISEEVFDQAQAKLSEARHHPVAHTRNSEKFPLRGLILCAGCGKPLTASSPRGKMGKCYSYYHCPSCTQVNIPKQKLESDFGAYLDQVTLVTSGQLRLFRRIVQDMWGRLQVEAVLEQATTGSKVAELERKRSVLTEKLLDGTITDAAYKAKDLEIETQLTLMRLERRDAEWDEMEIGQVLDLAEHLLRNARRLWEQVGLFDKHRLIRALFPKGITYGKVEGLGTPLNDSEAITSVVKNLDGSKVAPPRGFEPRSLE